MKAWRDLILHHTHFANQPQFNLSESLREEILWLVDILEIQISLCRNRGEIFMRESLLKVFKKLLQRVAFVKRHELLSDISVHFIDIAGMGPKRVMNCREVQSRLEHALCCHHQVGWVQTFGKTRFWEFKFGEISLQENLRDARSDLGKSQIYDFLFVIIYKTVPVDKIRRKRWFLLVLWELHGFLISFHIKVNHKSVHSILVFRH